MAVYPAAGLIDYVPYDSPRIIVDPRIPDLKTISPVHKFEEKASTGMEKVRDLLTTLA
jgi:NAD-dependent deacetylase